ncbi:MAG TPA: hypothetical protein VJ690_08315 [Burkholderiales bacterium]|nr:hypothetical protein [Burkholderiales bacterium]
MPILGAVVLLIQLCFAYHALRTGRAYWWLFVIIGFPVIGCLLYYFVEVFPNTRESVKAERAVQAFVKSFDPDRSLRERVANLEDCGSVENRIALARSCSERGLHAQAAALYRSCLAGIHRDDAEIRYRLAAALLGAQDFKGAHEAALTLHRSHARHRSEEVRLLAARALEGLGRFDDALGEYRVLADTYAGEEGRFRYAALLARMGKSSEAGEIFRRMLRNAERMPEQYREMQREWLAAARAQLHG